MGPPERTGQISWLESRGKTESARHQDGHRVRHFVSRCWHWHRVGFGAARLKGDLADRLPVVRRPVRGAICGLASFQGRTGHRHQPSDADAQYDGEVLILSASNNASAGEWGLRRAAFGESLCCREGSRKPKFGLCLNRGCHVRIAPEPYMFAMSLGSEHSTRSTANRYFLETRAGLTRQRNRKLFRR